jgi:hypothetical protein
MPLRRSEHTAIKIEATSLNGRDGAPPSFDGRGSADHEPNQPGANGDAPGARGLAEGMESGADGAAAGASSRWGLCRGAACAAAGAGLAECIRVSWAEAFPTALLLPRSCPSGGTLGGAGAAGRQHSSPNVAAAHEHGMRPAGVPGSPATAQRTRAGAGLVLYSPPVEEGGQEGGGLQLGG